MSPGPITNASSRPITFSNGALPDVSEALLGWFQPCSFSRITKTVVNYQTVETLQTVRFQGVIEPIQGQDLDITGSGQRAWKGISVWAFPDLVLIPDEIITIQGVEYRVLKKFDWSSSGYLEYHCLESYIRG